MTEDFAVALLQIANGRRKQATFVLLHLIGAAVEFVGPLIGLKKYIEGVEKVKMLYGVLLSRMKTFDEFFLTQEDYYHSRKKQSLQDFSFFLFYIFLSSIYREKYHFTREKKLE